MARARESAESSAKWLRQMNPYDAKTDTIRVWGTHVSVPLNMVLWAEFVHCFVLWATSMSTPSLLLRMMAADRYTGDDAWDAMEFMLSGPVSGCYAMLAAGLAIAIHTYMGPPERREAARRDRATMMNLLLPMISVFCVHMTLSDAADIGRFWFTGWTVSRFTGAFYNLFRLYLYIPYSVLFVMIAVMEFPSLKIKRTGG